MYSPTLFPFSSKASTGPVASVPSGFSSLAELALIGTDFSTPSIVVLPGANVTVPSCVSPCTPVDSSGVAVGVTPTIFGV